MAVSQRDVVAVRRLDCAEPRASDVSLAPLRSWPVGGDYAGRSGRGGRGASTLPSLAKYWAMLFDGRAAQADILAHLRVASGILLCPRAELIGALLSVSSRSWGRLRTERPGQLASCPN